MYGNRGSNVQFTYSEGDGNDVIYGVKPDSTIQIATNSSYTSQQSNNDVIIKVGEGSITLKDAKDKSLNIVTENLSEDENTIKYTSGNDSIQIPRDNVKVEALAGNDTVENAKKNVIISAGDGDDSIHSTGSQVTIDGGNGDDTVINSGDSVSIIGGANDDSIINYGDSTTIKGGTGTDTIRLAHLVRSSEFSCNTLIQYSLGDGNDTILDIASTDLIHITNGSYSTQVSGNDLIIKVGEDSITLKDAAGRKLQIKNASGEIETVNPNGIVYYCNNTANTQILGSSHADTIYNVAPKVTIETGEGNNVIYNRADNHYSPSLTSILVGSGDNIISNYNADQVTIKTGNGNNQISNWNGDKVTIQSGAGDDTISNDAEYAGNVSTAVIETGDGNDIISNGLYFSKVTIDAGNGNDSISNSGNNISINGGNGDDTVQIKSEFNNTTANGGQGSDTFTINLSTYSGQPRTGESATIQDYESGKDKIVLEEASIASHSISGSDVILTLKSENISDYKLTLKNAKGKEITFTDSDGNTIKQTYTDDNSDEGSFISYDQLTPEELQKLQESSINSLKIFVDSFEEMDITPLTFDECNNNPNLFAESRKWTKFAHFVTKLIRHAFPTSNVPDGVFAFIALVNDAIVTLKENKANNESLESTSSNITSMLNDDNIDFEELANKSPTAFAYLTYALSCVSNAIATTFESTEKRQNLERGISGVLKFGIDICLKKIGENKIKNALEKIFFEGAGTLGLEKALKIYESAYPFGPVNGGIALLTGAFIGADEFISSRSQYAEDQLPTATRDAFIDAIATGIYEAIHSYTYGADDAIVQLGIWAGSLISGKSIDIDEIGGNYMEYFARMLKHRLLGEISGTDEGDLIESTKDGELIYGGFGADFITNRHSNMSIYGGADGDTITSEWGAHDNYIDSGLGNDSITIRDNNSTIHGGNDKDTLFIV